jgi:hypothetical protein
MNKPPTCQAPLPAKKKQAAAIWVKIGRKIAELLKTPFNFIFFTSRTTGDRVVARAAADISGGHGHS